MEHRIEFDELKKLRDDLIKIQDEMDNFISDCAKELAARLLERLSNERLLEQNRSSMRAGKKNPRE